MSKIKLIIIVLLLDTLTAFSQNTSFSVALQPIQINGLGGLQAFAFGQADGKWLVVGGRLDGLHRRQPFASFDVAGNNNQLMVIDPIHQTKWTAPLTSLSTSLQEQLSSTNMEFHQEDNMLYIVGGYGYNVASTSRKTFPSLIAIDVPSTIQAIIESKPISTYFRQVTDTRFAVTGGHLKMVDSVYYLIGGNQFDGNYNPMGNPTYTQKYTNAVRRFTIQDNGTQLNISFLKEWKDSLNLHRRDYNAVPQIFPNGKSGITVFSGVFQYQIDLPYLNSVDVFDTGIQVNNQFQQYYNHYHCAVMPLYSSKDSQMHNIFFGGIAQYYDSLGVLVQDNNVPFVKTIARVTRDSKGVLREFKLPVEMPGYFGASAEFIVNPDVNTYNNEVIQLDSFKNDTLLAGYIYGGINSSAKNIFFTNNGTQSSASNVVYKVFLIKHGTEVERLNKQSFNSVQFNVYPNPNKGKFEMTFNLVSQTTPIISVFDMTGKLLSITELHNVQLGVNYFQQDINEMLKGGVYYVVYDDDFNHLTQKIVVEP